MTAAPPSPANDQRLSAAAFDARFSAIRPRLVSLCSSLVGSSAAEDVVQDTYLRGRQRIGQLRDDALLEAWLARSAINAAFNYQRYRRRWLNRLPDPVLGRYALRRDRDAGLRELLELLPARERTIIVLHHGYGYELAEIGKLLGLSHSNVRSIIRRTRLRLAKQLREAGR